MEELGGSETQPEGAVNLRPETAGSAGALCAGSGFMESASEGAPVPSSFFEQPESVTTMPAQSRTLQKRMLIPFPHSRLLIAQHFPRCPTGGLPSIPQSVYPATMFTSLLGTMITFRTVLLPRYFPIFGSDRAVSLTSSSIAELETTMRALVRPLT